MVILTLRSHTGENRPTFGLNIKYSSDSKGTSVAIFLKKNTVIIDVTADQQMTNTIMRDTPKTFLKRALCYYFCSQKYRI